MDDYTVSECERQADRELALAKVAGGIADRNRHLNRAAIFAYCSENARNVALRDGIAVSDDLPCCPELSGA